jgi:small subunit ribosomal protein S1
MNNNNNISSTQVGQQIHVCITRIDEKANELIISEKEAWVS